MYVIEGAVEDSVDDDDADDDGGGIMCTASMRAENTIIIPATYILWKITYLRFLSSLY